jgi:hypothetical protein
MSIIFVFLEIKIQFVNLLYEIHFNILNLGTKTKGYLKIKVMKLGTKTWNQTKTNPLKNVKNQNQRGSVRTSEPANTVSNSFGDFWFFSTFLGWMISGQETVFCWVPVPYLTMVVSLVAFYFLPTY